MLNLDDLFYKAPKAEDDFSEALMREDYLPKAKSKLFACEKQRSQKWKSDFSEQVICLNSAATRLYRDPHLKVKQGALEFNAYLIKRLSVHPEDPCIDLLYLNLKKLANSADTCLAISRLGEAEVLLRDCP